jgi:hypothetical protein
LVEKQGIFMLSLNNLHALLPEKLGTYASLGTACKYVDKLSIAPTSAANGT